MRLDGLHRDLEAASDLLVGEATGDEAKHLPLPWRQLVQFGIGSGNRPSESIEHETGEPRREDGIPIVHPADRIDQVILSELNTNSGYYLMRLGIASQQL